MKIILLFLAMLFVTASASAQLFVLGAYTNGTTGYVLLTTTNGAGGTGITNGVLFVGGGGAGSGTVTTVSVPATPGYITASVANATTTPAITLAGNGNPVTGASLNITNTASVGALNVTNTAAVGALNVTNTASAGALNVTNNLAASSATITNNLAAASLTATNGIVDNGPTSNRVAVWINHTLSNAPSITDGQLYVADAATPGGMKATNFPAGGAGTVTTVVGPSWLTVTGNGTATITLAVNGNSANFDATVITNTMQSHAILSQDADSVWQLKNVLVQSGSGDPNGSVNGTTGSFYMMDTTNGYPWVKATSGLGSTGWEQLQSAQGVSNIVTNITLPATNFLAATNGAGTNLLITNMTVAGYLRPVLGTAALTASTNYVVDFNLSDYENATLTADFNFVQSTNRSSTLGGKKVLTLYPNGTNRIVTLGAGITASWHTNGFYSTSFTLTNNTYATITFYCNGNTETNVFAKYQIWP